jgi:glycosyltransferase involved in cell wall biosynthesis
MEFPGITIIISVLNGAETLESCLASVFDQTYPSWELVVIDGGSEDATTSILRDHDSRIAYWESKPDRGIYHAWNKALDHASGEWICFLGADDRFRRRDSLEQVAEVLAGLPRDCRVAYASVDVVDDRGTVLSTVGRPWEEAREDFRDHMAIPHQATFHRRSLFEVHGRFDEAFRICGDYELLLRELSARSPHFIRELVPVAMGAGGVSDSPASLVGVTREFARARYMHGLTRVPPALSFAVFRARCRALITRALGPRAADKVANVYRLVAGKPKL